MAAYDGEDPTEYTSKIFRTSEAPSKSEAEQRHQDSPQTSQEEIRRKFKSLRPEIKEELIKELTEEVRRSQGGGGRPRVEYNENTEDRTIWASFTFSDDTTLKKTITNVYVAEQSGMIGKNKVIVKKIPLNTIQDREHVNLMELQHPNIVRYIHGEEDKQAGCIYLILELCHQQNLRDWVLERNKQTPNTSHLDDADILLQIAFGMSYIHKKNVLHRDLKPENILFSLDGMTVKVADFGFSKKIPDIDDSTSQSSNKRGTYGWRAAELLQRNSSDTFRCSNKTDVFSLGLVAAWLLGGRHPYGGSTLDGDGEDMNAETRMKEGIEPNLSGLECNDAEVARDLIANMLKKNADERYSMEDVLAHPYFWSCEEKLGFMKAACDNSATSAPNISCTWEHAGNWKHVLKPEPHLKVEDQTPLGLIHYLGEKVNEIGAEDLKSFYRHVEESFPGLYFHVKYTMRLQLKE